MDFNSRCHIGSACRLPLFAKFPGYAYSHYRDYCVPCRNICVPYDGGIYLNFALVLVIGTVVDNAIVVVEAVQAKFDEGYKSPYQATVKAMDGISTALITTSIVFMAIFIPVCFMGGTTGTFYTQFGLTMGVAVIISLLNAITLSPALCALLMLQTWDERSRCRERRFQDDAANGFVGGWLPVLNKSKNRMVI